MGSAVTVPKSSGFQLSLARGVAHKTVGEENRDMAAYYFGSSLLGLGLDGGCLPTWPWLLSGDLVPSTLAVPIALP